MDSHWETLIKNAETVETDSERMEIQPKLEVVIIEELDPECETIVEYLDDEIIEEDDGEGGDDVTLRAESDEDDQFIQTAQDFIKTVKKTLPTKLKKIQTRGGKILSAKSARIMAADTERLNFRSTLCPHSSQKLKKDNKWWRLMHDCNYCDAKDFLTVEAINKHLRLQHAELVKVSCDICKKSYSEVSRSSVRMD